MDRIDELIQNLHADLSPHTDRQFEAAIELGKSGDAAIRGRIIGELIKALSVQHQALTRAHAAEALGDFAAAQAIPALVEALKDPYRLVRSYAARALGKMRDREITKAIEPLVYQLGNDSFFGARAEAAEALGNLLKLCGDEKFGDDQLLEKARNAIERDDLIKLKESDGRFKRMVNEMNASIARLRPRAGRLSGADREILQRAEETSKRLV